MLARIRSAISAFREPTPVRSAPMWDGAASGTRTSGWTSISRGPNSYFDNPALMRARAEDCHRNNPFGRRGVEAIVNAAVGAAGINPQFVDRAVQAAWEGWVGHWWAPLLQELLTAVVVSGEAFLLLSIDDQTGGVPLRPIVLGPEHLDTSRIDHDTFDGIRYENGRPAGYWLHRRNPVTQALLVPSGRGSEYVPATFCRHIYRSIAPGAQRGQTWLAPVLLALRELDDYLGAALVRQKVGALYTGYLRTPDGSNPLAT
ncbi:MAG: phage portal protein, partial [Acidobacteria bacterium]|nr:phage portal protein [Acidobacteriota bacterium]